MPKGDCFQAAFNLLHDMRDAYLVHAVCIGRGGAITGIPFIHAWVEKDHTVFDYSNDTEDEIFADLYYGIGNVRWIRKYDFDAACHRAVATEIYGPWDIDVDSDTGDIFDCFPGKGDPIKNAFDPWTYCRGLWGIKDILGVRVG